MALKPVQAGLHRLKHDSAQPSKITLVVPPGDELEVSDDVAAQLHAASTHFVDPGSVKPAPRQVVKNADGEASEWSDGSPLTDDEKRGLGFLPAVVVAPEPQVDIDAKPAVEDVAAKPKKAVAKKSTAATDA